MARKTSGNSCGRTGSPIGCSNHSMISSITAAMPGTLSSISPGRSCPSRAAIGQTWVIQCEDWYDPSHGYHPVCTSDGIGALDLARKHCPDLILMDIQLPEVSGLEVTNLAQESP